MAKRLTDAERQEIIDLLPTGASARELAKRTGRSVDTISRIARSVGHEFGRTNLVRAREARSAYGAEARAELAAAAVEEISRLLGDMRKPHVAFSFGGKDNSYNERHFPEPDARSKRELAAAAGALGRMLMDIVRHDERADEVGSDFDEWLREKIGAKG
jgi:hypothetical protein